MNYTFDYFLFETAPKIFIGAIFLGVFLLISYGVCFLLTPYGPTFEVSGVVKALSYKSSGSDVGVSTDGKLVSTYHSSEHNVIIKLDNSNTWYEDNETMFNDVEQNQKLILTFHNKTIWGIVNSDLVSYKKL